MAQIANGAITNPDNIASIFSSPEDDVLKVAKDLGPVTQNKIIYDTLGAPSNSKTPEKLLSAYKNLDNQGLASYIPPDLPDAMDSLSSKLNNRKFAQTGAGALLGLAMGSHLGIPFSEEIGTGLGAITSPLAMKMMQKAVPDVVGKAIGGGIRGGYPLSTKAILANAAPYLNTLNGQGSVQP